MNYCPERFQYVNAIGFISETLFKARQNKKVLEFDGKCKKISE